jgi:hypothetical protein
MSRWFRHYAGMMRDEKLVRVAIRTKQPVERVLWIWGALLESAAEIDDNGRYDLDAAEVAYFLRADEADVGAILAALTDAGRLADAAVVRWGDRQFTSDRSAARVAAHRERKRAEKRESDGEQANGNDGVTLQDANGNAPETEAEADTEQQIAKATVVARKRASVAPHRMPVDWVPGPLPPDVAELVADWPPGRHESEAAATRDYWLGQRTRRPGWDLTFHNRIRDIHDRVLRDNRDGLPARTASIRPAASPRGDRPNPCLDMLIAAEAEIRAGENPEPDFSTRPALRAIGSV